MKRVALLFLVVTLIFGCINYIDSTTQYYEYAEKLKALGVFQGTDMGFELERQPTRLEGLVILLRLLGLEDDALALPDDIEHVFTDVPDWGKKYTVFAYKEGLTDGIGNQKFGANKELLAKSFNTFLLRALGYSVDVGDFTWDEANKYALEIGLISNNFYEELNSAVFLRSHMAKLTYQVLFNDLKESNTMLIDRLIEQDRIDSAIGYELKQEVNQYYIDELGHNEDIDENKIPLYVQGYRVQSMDYFFNEENTVVIKSEIFDIVGLDYPVELEKHGYINAMEYINYIQMTGIKLWYGINGDGVYTLYNPNITFVYNTDVNNANQDDEMHLEFNLITDSDYESYYKNILKLSKDFNGRLHGSQDLVEAANFLSSKFSDTLLPVKDNSLLHEFDTYKTWVDNEDIKIDNQKMIIMKDYMPVSLTDSININEEMSLVYVGSGWEEDYITPVSGKVVLFDHNNEGDTRGRVKIAKEKGAALVLITAGEVEIGDYEHPVNNNSYDVGALYISEETSNHLKNKSTLDLDIKFDVVCEEAKASNLVGYIEGKDSSKSILLVSNYDGYGYLPDGRIYENATASSASPAVMIELAEYYAENKPDYNIIFALVSGKWVGEDGTRDLIRLLENKNILVSVDLYATGSNLKSSNPVFLNVSTQSSGQLQGAINEIYESDIFIHNDFGNAITSLLKELIHDNIALRGTNTVYPDAFNDTVERVNQDSFIQDFHCIYEVINKVIELEKIQPVDVDFEEVDFTYNYIELEYIDFYYDNAYKEEVENLTTLHEIEEVYNRVADYNYDYLPERKISLFLAEDGLKVARIGGREDIYISGNDYGGGFASELGADFPIVYCSELAWGNFSHEINHLLNSQLLERNEYGVDINQEAHGKTYIMKYDYFTNDYLESDIARVIEYVDGSLKDSEKPKFLAQQEGFTIEWLFDYHLNPNGFRSSEWGLAAIYDFIYYEYGPLTQRRIAFNFYDLAMDSAQDMIDVFYKELGLTEDQLIEEWSEWILSDGEDGVDLIDLSNYEDTLTDYDDYWLSK